MPTQRGAPCPAPPGAKWAVIFISSVSHAHMARFMSFKGSFLCLAVPLHTKTCRFIKAMEVPGDGREFLIGAGVIAGGGKVQREGDF